MKRFFLIVIALFSLQQSYASHFSGGEIRYEFNGTDYDIYLTVYNLCNGGANLPTYAQVVAQSVSQSQSLNITMTLVSMDTIEINCPNTTNRCYNPSTGSTPGYIQAHFKGNVSLPAQANDWYISYNNCCRVGSIINGSANGGFYIDTWLDNTAAINSNPKMTTAPTYYLSQNDTLALPLQTIDPEGDSIAYRITAPLSEYNVSIPYGGAPFSLTHPLGNNDWVHIDASTHTLYLKSATQGVFDIAFYVDEYRNGVKIGSYIRDIAIAVLPSSNTISPPIQSSVNPQYIYTCPGQTVNTVVLNYNDPSIVDSVFLDVEFPQLSGWNFSAVTTNGIPSASTTISWTTPSTLNPATLPFFYIKVKARDNACPGSTAEYSLLVRTRQCLADSVWPGDANGDFTVNIYDPLAIAIASGQTGPTRPGANFAWTAQPCTNWSSVFVTNNTNMKHADCNGDGTVNNSDLAAVAANYNKSHPKGGRSKPTGNYDLYLDMTGILLSPGKKVSAPIVLGNTVQNLTDVYGIGGRILMDGLQLSSNPTVDNTTGWLINSGNAVNFIQDINPSAFDWVLARTDQQNVSGNGEIGKLEFTVPLSATLGTDVKFSFEDIVLINKDGLPNYDIKPLETQSEILHPEGINDINSSLLSASIVPNPTHTTSNLVIVLGQPADLNVVISDLTGKIIWSISDSYNRGSQMITIPADIGSGIYIVNISAQGQDATVLKWIKQ